LIFNVILGGVTPVDQSDSPWLIILLAEGRTSTTKGCLVISVHDAVRDKAFGELRRLRREFYGCLTARADAVFELADAVLCADGPVRSLAELSPVGEHRRGHGSSYAALAGWTSNGCGPPLRRCRCPRRPTGGWCWRWTSRVGGDRMRARQHDRHGPGNGES
jgi:hypothetical protein